MGTEWVQGRGFANAGIGMLAAALVVAAAMLLPASARAGKLIVPHATPPHDVTVHAPSSSAAPSPTPAPAPSPAPPPVMAAPPSPGNGSSSQAFSDGDLPGSEVPPSRHDLPLPTTDYSSDKCGGDCLQDWSNYLYGRGLYLELNGYPEDATALKEIRAEVDEMIRQEQAQAAGDGAGGGLEMPGDSIEGDGFDSEGSDVPTGTVEVIFGPGVPDLDPVDLGTWDLSGVGTFVDMMGGLVVQGLYDAVNGSTNCRKDSGGDEVPICRN